MRLIESNEINGPKTVLLEVEWVLRSRYAYSNDQVLVYLQYLADLPSAVTASEHFYTFDRSLFRQASRLKGALVRLLT